MPAGAVSRMPAASTWEAIAGGRLMMTWASWSSPREAGCAGRRWSAGDEADERSVEDEGDAGDAGDEGDEEDAGNEGDAVRSAGEAEDSTRAGGSASPHVDEEGRYWRRRRATSGATWAAPIGPRAGSSASGATVMAPLAERASSAALEYAGAVRWPASPL